MVQPPPLPCNIYMYRAINNKPQGEFRFCASLILSSGVVWITPLTCNRVSWKHIHRNNDYTDWCHRINLNMLMSFWFFFRQMHLRLTLHGFKRLSAWLYHTHERNQRASIHGCVEWSWGIYVHPYLFFEIHRYYNIRPGRLTLDGNTI